MKAKRELCQAVKYFHDNMQIHRDLKAGNILLSLDAKADHGLLVPSRLSTSLRSCSMSVQSTSQQTRRSFKAGLAA